MLAASASMLDKHVCERQYCVSSFVIHPPNCPTLSTEKLLTLLMKWCIGLSGPRCTSCRTGIQHKMQAAKQARKDLARTKPWRMTKQTYLIDAAITEVLSGHEILCVPHSVLNPSLPYIPSPVTWAHRLHSSKLCRPCLGCASSHMHIIECTTKGSG